MGTSAAISIPPEVLALGALTGMSYGLVAIGIVLAFRASKVINFAHGQIGAVSAVVLALAVQSWGFPYWTAFALALLVGFLLAAVTRATVVRRLQRAPPLMTMVGTIGVSQVLLYLTFALGRLLEPGASFPEPTGLPRTRLGVLTLTPSYWGMLLLAPATVVALSLFLRHTRTGLRIRAGAANADAARLLGIASPRMADLSWGLAGALAAMTTVLVLPAAGSVATDMLGPSLLLRALAAAALARMSSLPGAFVAGTGIGVVEEVLRFNSAADGATDLVLFGVILAAFLVAPGPLGRGGETEDWTALIPPWRVPAAARAIPLVRYAAPVFAGTAIAVAALLPLVASDASDVILTTCASFAIVGLSAWVLTGLSGQLSLGQYALAAIGGLVTVRVGKDAGSALAGLLAAPVVGAAVAAALGLSALRLRGAMVAIPTLGLALATQAWLLGRPWALGPGGRAVRHLGFFDTAPRSYLLALAVLLLALGLVGNLARSGIGRRMRAIRDNDHAAQAIGISSTTVRLQAFAIAGAVAAAGGAVLVLALFDVSPASFPATGSVQVVVLAVVGGLATARGPVLGVLYVIALPAFVHASSAALAATAAGWLVVILAAPGGLTSALDPLRRRGVALLVRAAGHDPAAILYSAASDRMPDERQVELGKLGRPAGGAPPVLRLEALERSFGGVRAIDGVTLEVPPGQLVAIVGPNGAGKSTLFDLATGFVAPDRGRVLLGELDITASSTAARAAAGLVRFFQDGVLFPTLTVREVIALGFELRRAGRTAAARADQLISLLALEPWRDARLCELSRGLRRITELACLIALEPAVALLDEPSAGLAQPEADQLARLLRELRERTGTTILVIEHNLEVVTAFADRMLVMADGKIVADGAPEVVARDLVVSPGP